jgi:uncharacterized protein
MRIELASLEDGKGKFAYEYTPGELIIDDERLRVVDPPRVTGEIYQGPAEVWVNGRVTGKVQLDCDRCLKAVEFPVDSKFKLEYVTASEYEARQAGDLSEEDMSLSVYDGEAIDVDALVSEELLLAAPDHVLCSDACKGICPECGADRNAVNCGCETKETDPRWLGLKELVNRK